MMLLEKIFRLILSLTLAGSLGSLLVLGVKRLRGDRMGTGWNYGVWLLPLTLYLVPFALPLGGTLPAGDAGSYPLGTGGAALSGGAAALTQGAGQVVLPSPGFWDTLPAVWEQALPALAWAWLLGLLFTAAVRLVDHRSLTRGLVKCSRPPEENGPAVKVLEKLLREMDIPRGRVELVLCPGVESPLLMGLLRTRVVLPGEDLPQPRLEMMLRHELNHYRGKDLWLKAAALTASCLHWFNPLTRQMVRDLDRCCELRCDRRTTGGMNAWEKKQYGRMLLDVAQGQPELSVPAGAATLTMDKDELKRRLSLLKNGSQVSPLDRAVSLAAALVVAVTGVVCSSAFNPGPILQGLSKPAAADAPGERKPEEVPELWGGDTLPESIPQPPLRMQAVLSDEVTTQDPLPAPEPEDAPAPDLGEDPASDPDPTPELEPGPASEEAPAVPEGPAESLPEPETDLETALEPDPEPELEPGELIASAEGCSWDGTLIWPVDGGYLSVGFNGYYGHAGMDIAADPDTEIYAAADGVVAFSSDKSVWPFGKNILINHGDGVTTRYAHCSRVLVQPGDWVRQGDLIALVGRTGNATGFHCHFQLQISGQNIDPSSYIGTAAP